MPRLLLLLIVTLAAGTLLAESMPSRPAQAAFPGANGKIAFVTSRDGKSEIYVMNADGTGQVNITNNGAYDGGPRWSPDGSRIAFGSNRDSNSDIYVMDQFGGNLQRLTDNPANDGAPAWSPDGSKIAFFSNREGGVNEIYTMGSDGSNQQRLTYDSTNAIDPVWSPGGKDIAYIARREPRPLIHQLYLHRDGSDTLISSGDDAAAYPDWSPDSQMLAFTLHRPAGSLTPCTSDVATVRNDGTGLANLTPGAGCDYFPSWSPDGQSIAFSAFRDGFSQAFVMDTDGNNQHSLTGGEFDGGQLAWQPLSAAVTTGDVTCEGTTDGVDAGLILQFDVGLLLGIPCPINADVNNDNRADSLDALIILQYAAGLLDQFS